MACLFWPRPGANGPDHTCCCCLWVNELRNWESGKRITKPSSLALWLILPGAAWRRLMPPHACWAQSYAAMGYTGATILGMFFKGWLKVRLVPEVSSAPSLLIIGM